MNNPVKITNLVASPFEEDDDDDDDRSNDRSSLEEENSRLRTEVAALQRELEILRSTTSSSPPSLRHVAMTSIRSQRRPFSPSSERERSLSGYSGDDTVTIEPESNVELHESAKGLIHRRHIEKRPATEEEETLYANDSHSKPRYDDDSIDEENAIVPRPEEPELFWDAVKDRSGWLVGLLCLQSLSSFIISRNEKLLSEHLVIVQFLTMLVGAGGNAGNQASVRVIRGLAIGSVTESNVKSFLVAELQMGLMLSAILGLAGCLRAAVFLVPLAETIAITTSLCSIVFISILLGALLPLAMKKLYIDPAHSATTIQVLMDILGVTITVHVSGAILESDFHKWLLSNAN